MKNIAVSVVVPTYNRKNMLLRCIESISKVDYPKVNYELIIVDDGSSDGTEGVIKKLIPKMSVKIKYLKQKNKGASAARNLGIRNAKGKIICFTDDDCIVEKNWIKKHVNWYKKNTSIVGVGGLLLPEKTELFDVVFFYRYKSLYITKKIVNQSNKIATCNCSYKSKILRDIGFFDETLFPGEDFDLADRIIKKTPGITVLDPQIEVYHLKRNIFNKSKMNEWFKRGEGSYYYEKKHDELFPAYYFLPISTSIKTLLFFLSLDGLTIYKKIQLSTLFFIQFLFWDGGYVITMIKDWTKSNNSTKH